MAEQTNPVQFDSKERVAYDLMRLILFKEEKKETLDRSYILTLYDECLMAVYSEEPENS